MALYRVRDGHELPHHGRVLTAGDTVELAEAVAADAVIRYRIDPVVVPPPPVVAAAPVERPIQTPEPTPDPTPEKETTDAPTPSVRRPVVKVKE